METRVLTEQRIEKRGENRAAVVAMYTGLAATVLATIVPYVDRATSHMLADHIRAGYPGYSQARIDTAVSTYLVLLTVIGVLGIVGWLWSIHLANARSRWARGSATLMFVLGVSVAVTDLLIKDTSGTTGLSPLLGWVGVLPCLPGLVAVTCLWRKS